MQTHKLIKLCSDTTEMEDVLTGFLKADALISAMEEKLEFMYKVDDENYDDDCNTNFVLQILGVQFSGPKICQTFLTLFYIEKTSYVTMSTDSLSVFLNFGIGNKLVSSNFNAPRNV